MMNLDVLQKLTNIVFKGLGAAVMGYFTITGEWRDFALREESFCIDNESYYMQAALRSESHPSLELLQRIQSRCGFASLEEAQASFHAERAGFQQIESQTQVAAMEQEVIGFESGDGQEMLESAVGEDGWVALGNSDVTGFVSNFELAGGEALREPLELEVGTVLFAKWPVNLRLNTENTTGSDNPSLAIIEAKACIQTLDAPIPKRALIWAPVILASCSGDPSQ